MRNLRLFLLIISVTLLSSAFTFGAINCQTPNGEQMFKIDKNSIAFYHDRSVGDQAGAREIASLPIARTRRMARGFVKIVNFEGKVHRIHIGNRDNFSELDDYISITSRQGHQMTYPLTCQLSASI